MLCEINTYKAISENIFDVVKCTQISQKPNKESYCNCNSTFLKITFKKIKLKKCSKAS